MIEPVELIRSKLRNMTQRELADELGISPGFLGDIVRGRRPASDPVVDALGLERVVTYRRKKVPPQSN